MLNFSPAFFNIHSGLGFFFAGTALKKSAFLNWVEFRTKEKSANLLHKAVCFIHFWVSSLLIFLGNVCRVQNHLGWQKQHGFLSNPRIEKGAACAERRARRAFLCFFLSVGWLSVYSMEFSSSPRAVIGFG